MHNRLNNIATSAYNVYNQILQVYSIQYKFKSTIMQYMLLVIHYNKKMSLVIVPRQHWHTWVFHPEAESVLTSRATCAMSAAPKGLGLHGITAQTWGSSLSHVAVPGCHVSRYPRVHIQQYIILVINTMKIYIYYVHNMYIFKFFVYPLILRGVLYMLGQSWVENQDWPAYKYYITIYT